MPRRILVLAASVGAGHLRAAEAVECLSTPDRLAQLTANAKRLGRPQAAFDVARAALDWPLQPR